MKPHAALTALLASFMLCCGEAVAAPSALQLQSDLDRAKSSILVAPDEALREAMAARMKAQRALGGGQGPIVEKADWLAGEALLRLSRPYEALPLLDEGARMALAAPQDAGLRGRLLQARAFAEFQTGRFQASLSDSDEAVALFQRTGDSRAQAFTLQDLSSTYTLARDYRRVLNYSDLALKLSPGDPLLQTSVQNSRGIALKELHRDLEAIGAFRTALAESRLTGSPSIQAHALTNLAWAYFDFGRNADAVAMVREGRALVAAQPSAKAEKPSLETLRAALLARTNDRASAMKVLDGAVSGLDLHETPVESRVIHELASRVYADLGAYEKAYVQRRAFEDADEKGRALATSIAAAVVGAKFDFAAQQRRIAQLKAERAQKDLQMLRLRAQDAARFYTILVISVCCILSLLVVALLIALRSRARISAGSEALSAANSALTEALEARTQFLALTSHEIRTPLNGIMGMGQILLKEEALTPDAHSKVKLIFDASCHLNDLVGDILDVARIERGVITVVESAVNVPEFSATAVESWLGRTSLGSVSFEQVVQANIPPAIMDREKVRQILMHLLGNASKFTSEGTISLKVGRQGDVGSERLSFSICDTGIGVSAADVVRIFDPFIQVDGGRSRRYAGAGLGLSLCRRLARALGGDVTVESRLGVGSTFTLDLPFRPVHTSVEHAASPLARVRLLALEANPLSRAILRTALAPAVASLEFATTLEEALGGSGETADIVILDADHLQKLSDEDGASMAERIVGALSAQRSLILVSKTTSGPDRLRFAAAADAICDKPIVTQDLLDKIRALAEQEMSDAEKTVAA